MGLVRVYSIKYRDDPEPIPTDKGRLGKLDINEKGFYIFLTDKGFSSYEAWQILNRFRCFKENKNDKFLKIEYKKSISKVVNTS